MSASIWAPGTDVISVDAENTLTSEAITATGGQTVFNLTVFTYVPGSESLAVFRNGQKLVRGVDFSETSSTSFTLTVSPAVVAGEVIEAVGLIGSSNANAQAAAASAAAALASAQAAAASAASVNPATFLAKADNLAGLANPSSARTNLGLGSAATLTAGTAANNVVQLDGAGKLPAVDGSQLTGIATGGGIVGAFRNLKASSTGLSANISVSADEIVVENDSNAYVTLRSVSLTIAGTTTGANALDAGTIAASTWYSVWVIYNGTTVAGLLSTSATAPTLPGGYTHKARVGWIRTDGTANKYPLSFTQYGRRIAYKVASGSNITGLPLMSSGLTGNPTTPTWTAVSTANFIPTTASQLKLLAFTVGSGAFGSAAPNNSYGSYSGSASSTTNPPPVALGSASGAQYNPVYADLQVESTNIYVATSGGSGCNFYCAGWEDNL